MSYRNLNTQSIAYYIFVQYIYLQLQSHSDVRAASPICPEQLIPTLTRDDDFGKPILHSQHKIRAPNVLFS